MIILPIELYVREAPALLGLVSELLDKGEMVLIGNQKSIQRITSKLSYKAAYLDKSLSSQKKEFYLQLPKNIDLYSHDIEFTGMVNPILYSKRFSKYSISRSKKILFHNVLEKKIVEGLYAGAAEKGIIVASHKFDFLRYKAREYYIDECLKVRKKYPNFIFIPSNFGGKMRKKGIEELLEWGNNNLSCKQLDTFKRRLQHKEDTRQELVEFLQSISKSMPEYIFILRPHPIESIEKWKSIDFPTNVIIEYEGPITPYIIESALVIHCGCTSSIEAYFLNKRQITFYPTYNKEFDNWIANEFTDVILSKESLTKKIKQVLAADESDTNINNDLFPREIDGFPRVVDILSNNYKNSTIKFLFVTVLIRLLSFFKCRIDFQKFSKKEYFIFHKKITSMIANDQDPNKKIKIYHDKYSQLVLLWRKK